MRVGVIGISDKSLANATSFAIFGHDVLVYDDNEEKIKLLKKNIFNIDNKQIKTLLFENKNRISFVDSLGELSKVELIVFTYDIESNENYKTFTNLFLKILDYIRGECVFLFKNKMPVGTSEKFEKYLRDVNNQKIHIAYQMENLLTNDILSQIISPTFLVVGTSSKNAHLTINFLYEYYLKRNIFIYFTSLRCAELMRIAVMDFLLIRNSFLYEINGISQKLKIDGNEFMNCFRKILLTTSTLKSNELGLDGPDFNVINLNAQLPKSMRLKMLDSVIETKNDFVTNIVNDIKNRFEDLSNTNIGIIGLSYYGGVSNVNNAMTINLVNALLPLGTIVYCFDTKAELDFKQNIKSNRRLRYSSTLKTLLKKVDCVVIMNKIEDIENLKEDFIYTNMPRNKVVFDPYNFFKNYNFEKIEYHSTLGKKIITYSD